MPIHRFDSFVKHPGVQLPARCVAVQEGAHLILISPIHFSEEQMDTLRGLGKVTDLVAPSLFHHLSMQSAIDHFPGAKVWGVRGLDEKRSDITWTTLIPEVWPYRAFLDLLPLEGADKQNETEFYHRPTRTLLTSDLCFNLHKPKGWAAGIVLRMMGIYNGFSVGKTIKKLVTDTVAFERSLAELFQWDFDAIVMSHGEPIEKEGKKMLQSALEARGFIISDDNLPPSLSKADAIKVAQQVCEKEAWPWEEPVSVTTETLDSQPVWLLKTNYMNRGRNVVMRITKVGGSVLQKSFTLR